MNHSDFKAAMSRWASSGGTSADADAFVRAIDTFETEAEQRGRRQALQGFLDVWGRMTSGIWTWKAAAEAVIRWAEEERDVCDGKAARRG